MRAYKCDICGGLYDKRGDLVVEVKQKEMECAFIRTVTYDEVDVCPDCLKALQNVINERKNQNGNET